MRTYENKYPVYLSVRISEKQAKKLVKKGKTKADIIRDLINTL